MKFRRSFAILGLLAALVVHPHARGADDAGADALKDKNLTKSGSQYVLADEAKVIESMAALRKAKAKLDVEMKTRKEYEHKIAEAKAFIDQCENKHNALEEKLAVATDPTIHNQIVGQMNLLVVKAQEAEKQKKTFEDEAGKYGGQAKADFVDQVMATDVQAQSLAAKYTELAADPDVKTLVDTINQTAKPHVRVGPSAPFTQAVNQLGLWTKEISTESIPLEADSGVNMVDVLLDGTSHKMVLDTGASLITLPSTLADELKMTPGPQDRPIQMKIADGNIIEGRLMKLKTVRVGRFTVHDVECVVLAKGLNEAPALLGGSFLSHFVVKLDASGGTLHLTELSKDDKMVTTTETGGGKKSDAPSGTLEK